MSKKRNINPLDYYGYADTNNFIPIDINGYKVKVSDKDGNIITLEKDGSLFAMVQLKVEDGLLKLIDVAHDSSLGEIDFPNAGHIENCRFDEDSNSILFDIQTLTGGKETVEIDVQSLVDIYEEGQGISFGPGSEEGKKTINIKLTEGEEVLQLSDSGLSLSDTVIVESELEEALAPYATTQYVDEQIAEAIGSGQSINERFEKIENEIELIDEQIVTITDEAQELKETKADRSDLETLSGRVETIDSSLSDLSDDFSAFTDTVMDEIDTITGNIEGLTNDVSLLGDKVDTLSGDVESAFTSVFYSADTMEIIFNNKNGEQVGSLDVKEIFNDEVSPIEDVRYDPITKQLVLILKSGSEIRIDLSDLLDIDEVGDGLEIGHDGEIRVKIDEESDEYLTVSSEGIKLSGIKDDIIAASGDLTTAINDERTRAISVEDAISDRVDRIITADTEQWDAIHRLQSDLDVERAVRETEITNVKELISAETSNRQASDEDIRNLIAEEAETARLNEAELNSKIAEEKNARFSADTALQEQIDEIAAVIPSVEELTREIEQERQDRIAGDNALGTRITEETEQRITKDNEIEARLLNIEDTYATIEYVDRKDAETLSASIETSKEYTDNSIASATTALRTELQLYSDSGDTVLMGYIDDNATKINCISNLKGVSGSDISNYDDSGNGILDVLHREFHDFIESAITVNDTIIVQNEHEYGFGEWNVSHREVDPVTGKEVPSGSTIFSVGVGKGDNGRLNALEIRKDGKLYLWVEDDYMCVNDILGMLAHETY